jgi:L(+)-tartrate dehydratase beta subunit
MRMERFEYEFIRETGVRIIIGKGGMKEKTAAGCEEFGAIHCILPAGNAVVGAVSVEEIIGAEWLDLGMPEAMWKLKAEKFGPLIVSIDSYGNNLIENNKVEFQNKKEAALERLKGKLDFMH